jgi:cell division protein FtsL
LTKVVYFYDKNSFEKKGVWEWSGVVMRLNRGRKLTPVEKVFFGVLFHTPLIIIIIIIVFFFLKQDI